MSVEHKEPLPKPPQGFRYYRSKREIVRDSTLFSYQHLLLRAWKEMKLTAVLTLSGIPTVYVRDEKRPLDPAQAAEVHRQFWNQGVATVLLLRDPEKVCVFSSMTKPVEPSAASKADIDDRLVETINLATWATWAERFYLRLATGQYYSGDNEAKFDPQQGVDAYLIDNLGAVRDKLTEGKEGLDPSVAHAFLGRVLFTCYLCDRGVIDLRDYFPNRGWTSLLDLLDSDAGRDPRSDLYGKLFRKLKDDFNGSMFDDDIAAERELIRPAHLKAIRRFLNGDEVHKHQRSLGFWAYDFKFIPVETISAIYEDFLEKEGGPEKRNSGAYHTPRFLAEMTLDLALEDVRPLRGKRFLDPAVGSGIFLVLLFNRLAAEWRATHRGKTPLEEQAKDLRALLGSLRGVDKNLTACRIACFSLYLAFLDQFDPPSLRVYMKATGDRLPSLLKYANGKKKAPVIPVVWEKDFLQLSADWEGQFDIVVGNPPWAGRGSKQIAHKFMKAAPDVLKDDSGRACLLLPSKVFLNRTDEFQSRWLRRVTLDKVVQLADYRFILFKEALCPCNIARFTTRSPDSATHEIEYVAPKVSRVDLRDGVISVAPQDRKWIPLRLLLRAVERKATAMVWKSHLWGTQRDLKFLDFLYTLPTLKDQVGTVKEMQRGKKQWCKGQGFQPLRPTSKTDNPKPLTWELSDYFVTPEIIEGLFSVPKPMALELGTYLELKGYCLDKLHRPRDERIYKPPLVLLNQGFTAAAFFDYTVRFQDSLQSISGKPDDIEQLLFLTALLRSKLARYFVFCTAANLGTERDKVHLFEVFRLPFFLPENDAAPPNSQAIIAKIAAKIRRHKHNFEVGTATLDEKLRSTMFRLRSEDEDTDEKERQKWMRRQREKSRKLQAELEPLIYEYFGLNEQEIVLVEDTCEIFDKSDTPGSLYGAKSIPTLQPVDANGLEPYAGMLTATLNKWTSGSLRVSASGCVDSKVGLGLVRLDQTKSARRFRTCSVSGELISALQRLEEASTERSGTLAYLRRPWIFDGTRIYIVKPALKGQWTRTAALNDAADLHEHIAEARRRPK
ncbi:Eco57I restriction-modification methylase domain-containing protein [Planctomycetota bacterium]